MKYRFLKYLRFSPFDTDSKLGRTQERYRLAAWGSLANIFSAGLSMLVLIITVPLTISYLGPERFGVWMTIASLAGMLSFLDLGVGNSFVSHIAKIRVLGDAEKFRNTVTRGLILLASIGLIIYGLLSVFNLWIPLDTIISVETELAREDVRKSTLIFILLFSLSIPLNGVYRIFQGIQKSWIVHTIKSIGSIISIVAVLILSTRKAEPSSLLMATYGVQTVLPAVLLIYLAKKNWLTVKPHFNWEESTSEYKYLLNIGGLFLILQIGTMLGWGADALIISSLTGAAAVAQFAIAQRLYQFVSVPMSILNTPLWGSYADAKVHRDKFFITDTLKKSLFLTLGLSTLLSVLLFLLSGTILRAWVGDSVQISESLLLGFMVWTIIYSTGHSFSMFLNGMHIIKPQVISVILFVLLTIPLKIYFVPEHGSVAVVWSTIIAYLISVILVYPYVYNRMLSKNSFYH